MAVVQRFTRDMIENYLRSKNLRFLRDNDGDFAVEFGYDADTGCELTFLLMAAGKQSQIYSILVRSDKHIGRADFGKMVMLCNTWNKDKRWPKAYLTVNDANTNGSILLEGQVNFETGIHQEFLDDFTLTIIAAAFEFWKWLHQEHGI